ncbi:DnaJ-domain-containing protein [Lentithecium fluviatile CBS 122367]|uniref:DnaJ-domain-containing protein n=1 Tax=Lentithecium fluviatile CBS 122367 TaxID=1168545 RepID=A0A6G1J490_9PLEO|nr:DnaJ-domain-containing protein [Lentithecium fluviatile CBS 122367]
MAPVDISDDYYAILNVPQTASASNITRSYRRLAKVEHPDKNFGTPQATAAFQLIQSAYETLGDAEKRRAYDAIWPNIRASCGAHAAAAERQRAAEQREKERERRKAEAERETEKRHAEERRRAEHEAGQKRKAEEWKQADERKQAEKARTEETQRKAEGRRQANARRRAQTAFTTRPIRQLIDEKAKIDRDVFELSRAVRRLEGEVKRLEAQDEQDKNKAKSAGGQTWGAYFASYLYSPAPSEEEKQKEEAKEFERLERRNAKRIKEERLQAQRKRLEDLRREMETLDDIITASKSQGKDPSSKQREEERRHERAKRKAEELRQQNEEKRREELRKQGEEERRQEARRQAEKQRKEDEEMKRQEAQRQVEALRKQFEEQRREEAKRQAEKNRAARIASEQRKHREEEAQRREALRRQEEADRELARKLHQEEADRKLAQELHQKEMEELRKRQPQANVIQTLTYTSFHTDDSTSNMWPIIEGRMCMTKNDTTGQKCTIDGSPEYVVKIADVAQNQLCAGRNFETGHQITGHCYLGVAGSSCPKPMDKRFKGR